MMKNSAKTNLIWKIFLLFWGMNMISVFIISIVKPENNLPMSKMILLSAVFICLSGVMYLFKHKLEKILQTITPIAMPVFILVYGIVLYLFAIYGRCNPIHDQEAVYQGALYFAGLSDNISWEYFARCNNNIMPTIILGIIFRVGSIGGILDPYYFAALLNVIQVMISMYCLFNLGTKRNKLFSAWVGILLFAMYFLPIAGHSMSLYTDSMSFSFGIAGFYFWEKNRNEENMVKSWGNSFLLGVLFGIAAIIKITAVIPLIAIIGYHIIQKEKQSFPTILCSLAVCVLIFFSCNYFTTLLPSEGLRDAYGTPKLSYWVGIGMKGNGGYIDNQDYSIHLSTIYGMDEKSAWSNLYIQENLDQFFNKEHIISKLRYNFANGSLGCSVFVQTADSDSLFYKLMHYNGTYFWRYTMIMTGLMFSVYLCIILGTITNLFKKHSVDSILVVSLLSVFGIMLYVMLFEANHRQLYNHLPWFILAAECGLADFWSKIHSNEK